MSYRFYKGSIIMENKVKITFKRKSIAIDAMFRPLYINSLVLLILNLCTIKKKSSLIKLNFIIKTILFEKEELNFEKLSHDNKYNYLWETNNFVIKSVEYGINEGLIILKSSNYELTEKGALFYKKIEEDEILLKYEKKVCKKLGKKLSEKKINELCKSWGE